MISITGHTGQILMTVLLRCLGGESTAMIAGFLLVLVLRKLAAHFRWNLPKVSEET